MSKEYFVYILASNYKGTIYVGITSSLIKRVWEHKQKIVKGFTSKYNVNKLVYYEIHDNPLKAIEREKQLKKWNREWKIKLIESSNPKWTDLYKTLLR